MPGHLEPAGKGRWKIIVEAGKNPATGKRKRIIRYIEGRKAEAEDCMAQLIAEVSQGTYIEPSKTSLGEYLLRWLQDYAKTAVRPITYESYESQVRKHLLPGLGAIQLDKLTPMHLQKHYASQLQSGLLVRSVQYQHAILRKALGDAVRWQLLLRNVAELVDPPKRLGTTGTKPKEPRALTPQEIKVLLNSVEGASRYLPLIQIALKTGLRRGELLGLTWADVDLDKRYLRVKQTLEKVGGKIILQEPKTEKSRRTIPFIASCIPVFKAVKKEQAENRLLAGLKYEDNGLVFCQKNGRRHDPVNISKQVSKIIKKAGIEGATLHSLRHTFASMMIARGVAIEQVQALMGHESIGTTMGTYHHILPGVLESALAQIEDL